MGKNSAAVVHPLPAATATDFRRELLDKKYDLIHFAGHADADNLVFEDEGGESNPVPLSTISDLIARSGAVRGVILNACELIKKLSEAISPVTIGMDDSIDDDAALEFSRGFYDAIVRRKTVEQAYAEGISAVEMAGYDATHIRLIAKKTTP